MTTMNNSIILGIGDTVQFVDTFRNIVRIGTISGANAGGIMVDVPCTDIDTIRRMGGTCRYVVGMCIQHNDIIAIDQINPA